MTRLQQATEWFQNQVKNNKKIFVNKTPIRHRKVLIKHKKIQINYGVTANTDYYTFSSSNRIS